LGRIFPAQDDPEDCIAACAKMALMASRPSRTDDAVFPPSDAFTTSGMADGWLAVTLPVTTCSDIKNSGRLMTDEEMLAR
jgi:hypothetical protein